MKVEAKKDGKGNIIITEDSFEMLLICLDNQKFVGEAPQNGDSLAAGEEEYYKTQKEMQDVIDEYNRECRKILHQKLIFELKEDGYFLTKRYEHQTETVDWKWEDVLKVRELLKNIVNRSSYVVNEGQHFIKLREPYIERNVFTSESHLTISEDGKNNRPWKEEEIEKIKNLY